ncbi:MAG: PHP domain-containing protein [Candidatus Woesearchaeota archaeon]
MRYDLHVHSEFSRCSNLKPKDILRIAKLRGLDGIAITDHNSIEGAVLARKLNKDKNFEVIIGEEIDTEFGHVLAYYLNKTIAPGYLLDILDSARSQGAIVALAHPFDFFRESFPTGVIISLRTKLDAVEVFNSRSLLPIFNRKAFELASELSLAKIAGSDAHFSYEIGRSVTLFDSNLRTAIRNRKTKVSGSAIFAPFGILQTFLHRNIGIL